MLSVSKTSLARRRVIIEFSVVTALIIAASCMYILKEFTTPLLYGIDGPYYIQVSSILMSGHLKYPDPPLSFYILTAFSVLLNDIIAGIKVGSVITTLLAAYAIYYIVRYITNPAGGLIASLFYLSSPMLIRMMFDLIKNAMGLTFLTFTLLFCYLAVHRHRLLYSVFAVVFAVLTGLTHILDFAVMYYTTLLLLVLTIVLNRKELKYVTPPFAASTVILALGFTYYSIMGGDPYKGVSFINMLLTQLQHLAITSYGVSAVAYPLAVGVAGVAFALTRKNPRAVSSRLIISASAILILLNVPIIPQQFLWRFNLMTAILAPLIIGVIIGSIGKLKHVLLITLILVGLMLPQMVGQIQSVRPSISLQEYNELKHVTSIAPNNTVFIVPDMRLKYWVETLAPNVVRSLKELPPNTPAILVIEKLRKHPPIPP